MKWMGWNKLIIFNPGIIYQFI